MDRPADERRAPGPAEAHGGQAAAAAAEGNPAAEDRGRGEWTDDEEDGRTDNDDDDDNDAGGGDSEDDDGDDGGVDDDGEWERWPEFGDIDGVDDVGGHDGLVVAFPVEAVVMHKFLILVGIVVSAYFVGANFCVVFHDGDCGVFDFSGDGGGSILPAPRATAAAGDGGGGGVLADAWQVLASLGSSSVRWLSDPDARAALSWTDCVVRAATLFRLLTFVLRFPLWFRLYNSFMWAGHGQSPAEVAQRMHWALHSTTADINNRMGSVFTYWLFGMIVLAWLSSDELAGRTDSDDAQISTSLFSAESLGSLDAVEIDGIFPAGDGGSLDAGAEAAFDAALADALGGDGEEEEAAEAEGAAEGAATGGLRHLAEMVGLRVVADAWDGTQMLWWKGFVAPAQALGAIAGPSAQTEAMWRLCIWNLAFVVLLMFGSGACFAYLIYSGMYHEGIKQRLLDQMTTTVTLTQENEAGERRRLRLDPECVVCRGTLEVGDTLRCLPCGHSSYHRECIDQWLTAERDTCPLCSRSVGEAAAGAAGAAGDAAPVADGPDRNYIADEVYGAATRARHGVAAMLLRVRWGAVLLPALAAAVAALGGAAFWDGGPGPGVPTPAAGDMPATTAAAAPVN